MRKHDLKNPKLKLRTKKIDFVNDQKVCVNMFAGQTIKEAHKNKLICTYPSANVLKMYYVANRLFFYADNYILYEYDFSTSTLLGVDVIRGKYPLLTEIRLLNKSKVLVCCSDRSFVVGDNTSFNLPMGNHIVSYNGRCLIANGKDVYFTGNYDFENSAFTGYSGKLCVEDGSGDVKGMCEYDGSVLIFCENAVYRLSTDQDTIFELKKLAVTVWGVVDGSVKCTGGEVYFLCDNKLCVYKGSSVTQLSSLMDSKYIQRTGVPALWGDKYVIPVMVWGQAESDLIVYDGAEKSSVVIRAYSDVIGDGGFLVDNIHLRVHQLSEREGQAHGERVWISENLDFSSMKKKSLVEIGLYLSAPALLYVNGEFGNITYYLEEGYTVKRLNAYSRCFNFQLSSYSDDFSARDFYVKYTGE